MMTSNPASINLCSTDDTGSFLLRAYGFNRAEQARAYRAGEEFKNEIGRYGEENIYPAITLPSGHAYVIRESARHNDYSCNDVLHHSNWARHDRRSGEPTKPTWVTLRSRETAKPAGAYNTCILVEGRRLFSRHESAKRRPEWWGYAVNGPRHCFTVWGRQQDGAEPSRPTVVEDALRFYVARSGRGVVYARERYFNDDAEPCGEGVNVALIEFTILDKDQSKDDCMRVSIRNLDHFDPARLGDLDPVWTDLIETAKSGFDRFCKPIPDQVDEHRRWFLDQRRKDRTEGPAFTAKVRGLDWQEALKHVVEPWQLKAVISAHCNNRFDSCPYRYDSNASRVSKMLTEHECDDARREELRAMVGFIACQDRLWNYTGD